MTKFGALRPYSVSQIQQLVEIENCSSAVQLINTNAQRIGSVLTPLLAAPGLKHGDAVIFSLYLLSEIKPIQYKIRLCTSNLGRSQSYNRTITYSTNRNYEMRRQVRFQNLFFIIFVTSSSDSEAAKSILFLSNYIQRSFFGFKNNYLENLNYEFLLLIS